MEGEQFKKLVELLEELNEHMGNISSNLSEIDNDLDLIRTEIAEGVKVKTREYKKYK